MPNVMRPIVYLGIPKFDEQMSCAAYCYRYPIARRDAMLGTESYPINPAHNLTRSHIWRTLYPVQVRLCAF
jgi:hypothetical protein